MTPARAACWSPAPNWNTDEIIAAMSAYQAGELLRDVLIAWRMRGGLAVASVREDALDDATRRAV